ncbi:MAG: hypothetical protein JKY60_06060 [Kordiimonadaceae bacterium]|nr:hypothetical protein [Kordiimonadaceae bacterium]
MERLLEASSEPVWVFSIFLFAVSACHYVFIYKYPLNVKQWKLVEYVWVSLALISVFGLVEEARSYKAQNLMIQSRTFATEKIDAFENWLEVYEDYACLDNGEDPAFRTLCDWVRIKDSDLQLILQNEDFPADVSRNFLSGIEQPFKGLTKADKDIGNGLHMAYVNAREQFLVASDSVERSLLARLLVAFAPLVFALAIAIKLTKVTGEYRLCK